MHGCNSGPTFLVNAEVDSMRGVVDCGDDKLLKASLSQAAIDKALADISHEIDFREERKKEIEFLEKGRDYLEFKPGNAASVSVQSTSLKEQHHKQIVTRFEAKGSFAVAASPHGGLVDSSAKPVVASISEPDTADNILLFNRENELAESKKRPLHSNRRDLVTLLEQPLKTVGSQNAKVPVNSAIFLSYARKNRSRPNHGPRGASRDGKGLISETNNQNVHNLSFVSKPKSAHLNDDLVVEDLTSNIQLDNELDHVKPNQTDDGRISGREGKLKITDNRSVLRNHNNIIDSYQSFASSD